MLPKSQWTYIGPDVNVDFEGVPTDQVNMVEPPTTEMQEQFMKNCEEQNLTKRISSPKEIYGDLIKLGIEGKFDVIIHGCNCFHTMGAGIAYQIQRKFPSAFLADFHTIFADPNKLGTYSYAIVDKLTIVNAYTQYDFRNAPDGSPPVSYDAIRSVFAKIKTDFSGKRIGYPMIGAGLAGGDWKIISSIINEELNGEDHTLVIYKA